MTNTDKATPRSLRMKHTVWIDGEPLTFKRSIAGWVAVLAPELCARFYKRGEKWFCKLPTGIEPLCEGNTMTECFRTARVIIANRSSYSSRYYVSYTAGEDGFRVRDRNKTDGDNGLITPAPVDYDTASSMTTRYNILDAIACEEGVGWDDAIGGRV